MSASGKTTIGRSLFEKLDSGSDKWVFLDGDTFRNILGEDLGHTIEDRRKNAYRISRLCEYFDSQGLNVVACVLSIFHDNQKYNKKNISQYREVFIDVDFNTLKKRDNKHLYDKALKGEISNVVGVDIEFKKPFSPDMVIDNNSDQADFDKITDSIIFELGLKNDRKYAYTKNNLLNKPHKYQYSKFEGRSFIDQFCRDRNEALVFLGERFRRVEKACQRVEDIAETEVYVDEGILQLKTYIDFLLIQPSSILKENKNIIDTLIKRFEVSKKLFETYDSLEYRKYTTKTCSLVVYGRFSLLLQIYYQSVCSKEEKLIYFNSILKVNDILSSVRVDMITLSELDASIKAIEGELNIMKEYL